MKNGWSRVELDTCSKVYKTTDESQGFPYNS